MLKMLPCLIKHQAMMTSDERRCCSRHFNRWFGGGEQLAACTKTVPFCGSSVAEDMLSVQITTLSTELSGQHIDIFCILLRENLNDQLRFNTSFCITFDIQSLSSLLEHFLSIFYVLWKVTCLSSCIHCRKDLYLFS